MCGRNAVFGYPDDIEDVLDASFTFDFESRYNIAPGQPTEVITDESPGEITQHHWGLIPFWADEPDEGIINARAETVDEKQVFKTAWEERPCLVLSSGFYEWQQQNGGPKQPYRIYKEDAPVFTMAGLWETWEGDEDTIACVTILTTEPNDVVESIHDRMPVVLPRDAEKTWLEGTPDDRKELCQPYPGDDLDAYAISTQVNNPGNDEPSVIEPLGTEQSGLDSFG